MWVWPDHAAEARARRLHEGGRAFPCSGGVISFLDSFIFAMTSEGRPDTDLDDLRKHLAALKAAGKLYVKDPQEARGTSRRLASTLARGPESSLGSAAQTVVAAPDEHVQAALEGLIAALEEEIALVSAPRGVVLLVEDDAALVKLFSHTLTQKGWTVAVAGTAEQAEAIARTQHLSVIVLDLVLPDADGRNLLLHFKRDSHTAAIPVIVASAHDDSHVQAECFALGASDFLKKPVKPKKLLDLITRRAIAAPARGSAEPDGPSVQLADTAQLRAAFRNATKTQCTLAMIGVASSQLETLPPAGAAITRAVGHIGAAVAKAIGGQGIVARIGVEELAALFVDCTTDAATRRLEEVRDSMTQGIGSELDLAAGITPITAGMDLDEAMDEAGRLLYLAIKSAGTRILSDSAAVPLPTVKILLAEDDELTAKLLIYRLTREPGFEVTHSPDGLDALAVAEHEQIDLAILDINMPGIDGFDLLSRLREIPRYADLPVAMLTALGSERDVVRGLELGANDYIVKPFSPTEVIARVRRLLGRSQRAR